MKCSNAEGSVPYSSVQFKPELSGYQSAMSVYNIPSELNMKMMMKNIKLDEMKYYDSELSNLEEELESLINTSKYDIAPGWPLGKFARNCDCVDINLVFQALFKISSRGTDSISVSITITTRLITSSMTTMTVRRKWVKDIKRTLAIS